MNKQQFQKTLHDLAAQNTPSNLNLWSKVQARVSRKSTRSIWSRMLPVTRLGWVGIALAAIFALSVTVYAASPVLSRLFQMDDQLKNADLSTLGQTFELSQTIDTVTVTLHWAYAEPDRILISYSIQTSDGSRFDGSGELTGADGTIYEPQGGYGVTGQSDILNVDLPPGEGVYIITFPECLNQPADEKSSTHCFPINQSSVLSSSGVQTLNLHLIINAHEFVTGPTAVVTLSQEQESGNAQVQAEVQPVSSGAVVGPFTFDISIPVLPSSPSR